MKILIDHRDGRYSVQTATDTNELSDAFEVADPVWEEYLRHVGNDGIWQALWQSFANERSVRRREQELMPLEDARMKIEQLETALLQTKRRERFYARDYFVNLNRNHRALYREYACVYPKPGCNLAALPRLTWQEDAAALLEEYNEKREIDDLIQTGCCCGVDHLNLDAASIEKLRKAGFVVIKGELS